MLTLKLPLFMAGSYLRLRLPEIIRDGDVCGLFHSNSYASFVAGLDQAAASGLVRFRTAGSTDLRKSPRLKYFSSQT